MAPNSLIEDRMAEIGAALELRGRYRDRVLTEIRAHLEDATDAAVARGLPSDEAARLAIEEVGDPRELAERFNPQATAFTRRSVVAVLLGAGLAYGSLRAANELHADDARLGSSVPYTLVWAAGWVALFLIAGPVIALFARHWGRLGRSGILAGVAVSVTVLASLGFHFTNDGSLSRGPDPDQWRYLIIVSGALATVALAAMLRRTRLVPWWPTALIGSGEALVAAHYLALNGRGGNAAIAGLVLVAMGGAAYAVLLGRERPLA